MFYVLFCSVLFCSVCLLVCLFEFVCFVMLFVWLLAFCVLFVGGMKGSEGSFFATSLIQTHSSDQKYQYGKNIVDIDNQ